MAFPQTPLPIFVELSLNGTTWTDITTNVRADDQVQITRGRSDWGQQVDAGRCSFSLDNTDGKYSPRNPEGTYYGQIGRNTPVRVSVKTGSVAAWFPATSSNDNISTPDNAALDITGDIDVRLDATLMNWYLADGTLGQGSTSVLTELIGKFTTTGDQRSWVMYTQYGFLKFSWSQDGGSVNGYVASSTAKIPIPASGRLAVRVTLDVDNGAGGWTARFYTADSLSGVWVQLGDAVIGAATTSIFNSTSVLNIGNGITGTAYENALGYAHAAEVRNGIGGTAVANPDFSTRTSGDTSFTDAAGRTWTVNGNAEITNRKIRFVGEVSSWTPSWDTGGFDVITRVEAAGIMRRLSQGAVPTKSPMYREFTSSFRSNIVAYWPMEDAAGATTLASALDGHPAMTISGSVTPANYSTWTASDPVVTVGTGSMKATVPSYTATSYLFLRIFVTVPAAGVASTQRLFSMDQTGTATTWSVYLNTAGSLDLRAYDSDGTQILAHGFTTFAVNGLQESIGVELTQSGSNINYSLFVYDIETSTLSSSSSSAATGTLNNYTVGRATAVRFGEDGLMNSTAFGHLAISDNNNGFASTAGALLGWKGETAAARVHRLGVEESIEAFATAPGDEQMGVQERTTILELMRSAQDADEGILAEQRNVLGIRLVQRTSLYNEDVAFTMAYSGTNGLVAPLDPVDDDQSVTNDVTVQRDGGSSARVTLTTGALSTQVPPNGIGLYDTSYTLNLFDDTQPADHAGWKLHLGTWDETRFPQVTVNLAEAPASIENASAVDIGSRMQITSPDVWLPPDTLDLLVQGYTEVMDQYTWTIIYNCTPYGPWSVGWAGDDDGVTVREEFAWADTAGSQLVEALTTTETDVDVITTTGAVWTGDVGDTPFDWRVGGEVMTVTAPQTLLNTNAFFTTDTTGWTAASSTIARSTAFVNPHPNAVASLLITPDGVAASGGANSAHTAVGSVLPDTSYTASMWVYSPGGWSDLRPAVDWYTSADAFISTSLGSGSSVSAGAWTYLEQTFTAPATASRASMRARHGSTPASTDVYYVWAVRITQAKSSWLHDAFGRTASSSWGTADSGQAWTTGGGTAADFNVTGGFGSHRLATVNASRRTFTDFTYANFDYYVDVTGSATATGGSLFGGPTARYTDSDNLYMARLEFTTTDTVTLTIRKRVAAVETLLGTYVESFTYTPGTFVRVRFQGTGTALKAKAWLTTDPEPGPWQIEVTDSSLTTSSLIGLRSISSSANTNVNPEIRYDTLDLVNPQTFTVTRSVNGVTKTHAAGADVRLAYPAITSF